MRSEELKQKLLIVGVTLIVLGLLMFVFGIGEPSKEQVVKNIPLQNRPSPTVASGPRPSPAESARLDPQTPEEENSGIRLLTELDSDSLELRDDLEASAPAVSEPAPAVMPPPEPEPEPAPAPVIEVVKTVEPPPPAPAKPAPAPKPEPVVVAKREPAPKPRVTATIAPPASQDPIGDILKRTRNIHDTDWLLKQGDNRHTIQLLASYGYNDVLKFARRIDPDVPVAIYRTRRSGRDWYALVYGVYDSMREAKSDIGNLPEAWQSFKPWPRSMASLKKTIQGN